MRSQEDGTALATRLLNQPKGTIHPGTDDAAQPFFSPGGQWIGVIAGQKLKNIPLSCWTSSTN
jgi:hypothetical protein